MTKSTKIGCSVLVLMVVVTACMAALNHRAPEASHPEHEHISYEAEASSPQVYESVQPAARLASYRKSQPQQFQEEYNRPVAMAQSQKFVSIGEDYAPASGGVRKPLVAAPAEELSYAPAPQARKPVEERVYQPAPVRKPAAPVPTDYSYPAPAAPVRKLAAPVPTDYSYPAPAAAVRKPAAPVPTDYSYPAPAAPAPTAPVRKPVAEEYSYSAPAAPARKQVSSGDSYAYSAPAAAPTRKLASANREESERLTLEQNSNAHYQFASAVNDGIQDQSQVRKETRDGLKVSGEYSYSDGFVRRTVKYEADENGYRVVGEEQEPIGGGPQVDLVNGKADVHTQVQGVDTVYSISAHDFVDKDLPASAPQQVAKPKSQLRFKEAEYSDE